MHLPGGTNRTGAGFHRDSRREARMSRADSKRWAIEEDLRDLGDLDDIPEPEIQIVYGDNNIVAMIGQAQAAVALDDDDEEPHD